IYQKGYDTTSERETTYKRIKTAIESMEGIKLVKHSEDYEKEQDEYSKEKEDYEIKLSLLKGLDGGGTISLGASSVTALLDSMKEE
ncbi:MAG: hypothetical protein IKP71_07115, partial [Candidatus Riflebacteria bacterium]|nr:hypothetical protein [Candidatus Riflebacteria bacterium]